MNPKKFGKYYWTTIHLTALGYDESMNQKTKLDYIKFYESIFKVLPCFHCVDNFKSVIKRYPPNFESRQLLFNWTVDIHNAVNEELRKKKISYEMAYSIYKNLY